MQRASFVLMSMCTLLAVAIEGHSGGQRRGSEQAAAEESVLTEALLRRAGERSGASAMGNDLRAILSDTPESASASGATGGGPEEDTALDTLRLRRMMHAYGRRTVRSCRATNLLAIKLMACDLHENLLERLSAAERQAFTLALLASTAANKDESAGHALGTQYD